MADLWGLLGALAAIVMPMLLARWLLFRPERRQRHQASPSEKMPPHDGG